MCAGQSPDAHRTPRAFRLCAFVAPKAQGMVSGCNLPFPLRPGSHFFSHIFSIAGSKQSGEGAVSRARGFCAFIGANAETLDSAPALGTLSNEKMGSPLPVAAGFFSRRFFPRRLLLHALHSLAELAPVHPLDQRLGLVSITTAMSSATVRPILARKAMVGDCLREHPS
jgi:hypothetical protein